MSQEPTKKKRRGSSRYSYVQPAQCIYKDKALEAETQNISTSGLLISVNQKIDVKGQITLSWEDPEAGQIEGDFYVIREFQAENAQDTKFYYGLRYYKLEMASKERLLGLLNRIKGEAKKEAEKISLDSIYAVLDRKEAFFMDSLEGVSGVHAFYKSFLEKMKHYEIEAFQAQDNPYTKIVRQYVVYHFQATVLKNVISYVIKKPARYVEYLEKVNGVLNSLEEVALEEDEIFNFIDNAKVDDAQMASMKMNYNESSNRSFYGKQAMMEKVIKEMESLDTAPEIKAYINAINERYDRTMELTNPNMQLSDIHTVSKYTPGPYEEGEGESSPIPGEINKKALKKVVFLVVLVLFMLIRSVSGFVGGFFEKREYAGKLDLPVSVESVEKQGYQLNVQVDTQDWEELNPSSEESVVKKVQAYLRKEGGLKVCILKTGDGAIRKIITDVQ